MTRKETKIEEIMNEEKKFIGKEIGNFFVKPKEEVAGYESIKVELMSPISKKAYKDWINSAFYSSMATWDKEPENPISEMLNGDFSGREERLKNILKERPISVALEGVIFNFKITGVPRTMTHQIVRHRKMSFGQQSFRVSSCYSDAVRIPQSLLEMEKDDSTKENAGKLIYAYKESVKNCRAIYKKLIETGIPMEQARNIMPMGTCTKIGITMRLRDLIDYVRGRTSDIAQDEHSYIVYLILKEVKEKQPEFFGIIKMFVKNINEKMNDYDN